MENYLLTPQPSMNFQKIPNLKHVN